jgi:hypothetical protein
MKLIDTEYLKTPFYGSRKMAKLLSRLLNRPINRKRVQRSDAADGHRGHLSKAQYQPARKGTQNLSVPAQGA